MNIIDTPSPSADARPFGVKPRAIIIHATAGKDAGDLAYLRNGGERGRLVSYHYLLVRNGQIHRLVRPEKRAWHAGESVWNGVANVNAFSIGIGLSNMNNGEPFTEAQYRSTAWLCTVLMREHGIPLDQIIGHYHIAPGRKTDPGFAFEWMRLAAYIHEEQKKPAMERAA